MSTISQAKIKFVQSLKRKKNRQQHNAYVIEGMKACQTAFEAGIEPVIVVVQGGVPSFIQDSHHVYEANEKTMKQLSSFDSVPDLLCVFPMSKERQLNQAAVKGNVILFLDRIQDPGNLGTIIRTADWYGQKSIILNKGCVDVYNSKVIQATMGSHFNIDFYQTEFEDAKVELTNYSFVGLDMQGRALDRSTLPSQLVLIVGNEGQGISLPIRNQLDQIVRITGHQNRLAESLNAAVTTAISLDRLLR